MAAPSLLQKDVKRVPTGTSNEQKTSIKTEGHKSLSQLVFDTDSEADNEEKTESKDLPSSYKPMSFELKDPPKRASLNWEGNLKNKKEETVQPVVDKSIDFKRKQKVGGEGPSDFVRYMMELMDIQRDYLKIKHRIAKTRDSYRELAIYDKELNKRVDQATSMARECLARLPL